MAEWEGKRFESPDEVVGRLYLPIRRLQDGT